MKLWRFLTGMLLVLVCSAGGIVSAYELEDIDWTQTQQIYYDDFSSDTTAAYEYGNSSPTYNAADQSATITMETAGNFYLELPEISPQKRFVILTYQAKVSAKNQVTVRPMLYKGTTKYAIGEDTTESLSAADTFYQIAVIFDREQNTSEIFLAGEKVQTGEGTLPSSNWSLRLLAKGVNLNAVRTMTLDEIAVYESDNCFAGEVLTPEAPVPEEPYLTVDGQRTEKFGIGDYQVHVGIPALAEERNYLLLAAQYRNDILVDVDTKAYVVSPSSAATELVLDAKIEQSGVEELRCFVWDDLLAVTPVLASPKSFSPLEAEKLTVECMYPGFTFKAATFSFDDGNVAANCDVKLLDLFKTYSVKGTFNLYPYRWRDCTAEELQSRIALYDGHEVANHSYSHCKTLPYEDENNAIQAGEEVDDTHTWTEQEAIDQIRFGDSVLQSWFGYDIRGFVYPGGYPEEHRDAMKAYMAENGICYARPVAVSGNFDLPADWLGWKNTCKSENMGQYKDAFFALNPNQMQVFAIWGHSQDLNTYATWEVLEEICQNIQQSQGAVWNPTNIELYDYVKATEQLEIGDTYVKNNSDMDLYLRINNQKVCLQPGESYPQT